MVYIQNISGTDFFSFVPRSTAFDRIEFTNQTTGKVTDAGEFAINMIRNGVQVIFVSELKNDTFYKMRVYNMDEEIYRGVAFVSNQYKSLYSVNNNTYTANSSDNEFITI